MPLIEIRYARPPGRVTVFRQQLVRETPDCAITLLEAAAIAQPLTVRGGTVLEPGSPILWFTFPGVWHDIGRFHTRRGRFTGYYANVLTPVEVGADGVWETTDLFLDVWLDAAGPVLLDEDELAAACGERSVSEAMCARARQEAARLMAAARAGTWPPAICAEWTLERARRALADEERGTPGSSAV